MLWLFIFLLQQLVEYGTVLCFLLVVYVLSNGCLSAQAIPTLTPRCGAGFWRTASQNAFKQMMLTSSQESRIGMEQENIIELSSNHLLKSMFANTEQVGLQHTYRVQ